jgi:GTPase
MSGADAIAVDAAVRLDDAAMRPPLRFLTCGLVDNGKSTLLGRCCTSRTSFSRII